MIKHLYHCADIHIRLYKRHDEYREQIQKFFDSVKQHMEENELTREEVRIVIAGDVVHSKNQMTPELINIVTWFFKGCKTGKTYTFQYISIKLIIRFIVV